MVIMRKCDLSDKLAQLQKHYNQGWTVPGSPRKIIIDGNDVFELLCHSTGHEQNYLLLLLLVYLTNFIWMVLLISTMLVACSCLVWNYEKYGPCDLSSMYCTPHHYCTNGCTIINVLLYKKYLLYVRAVKRKALHNQNKTIEVPLYVHWLSR